MSGIGGARPGAGRKPGSANVRTREIADRAAAEGLTPLEYLVELMRKPYPENATPEVMAAYDSMRMDAAKAAAPYMHPRLGNVDAPVSIGALSGNLAEQARTVLDGLGDGRLTPSEAATVMQTIAAQAKIIETSELEQRIAALEQGREQKPQPAQPTQPTQPTVTGEQHEEPSA